MVVGGERRHDEACPLFRVYEPEDDLESEISWDPTENERTEVESSSEESSEDGSTEEEEGQGEQRGGLKGLEEAIYEERVEYRLEGSIEVRLQYRVRQTDIDEEENESKLQRFSSCRWVFECRQLGRCGVS